MCAFDGRQQQFEPLLDPIWTGYIYSVNATENDATEKHQCENVAFSKLLKHKLSLDLLQKDLIAHSSSR